MVVTLGGSCPGGSCPDGSCPGWYFTLGGSCPGVVVRVVVVRVVVVLDGSCPRG